MSDNLYENNQDLRFILDNVVNWDSFVSRMELDFRDSGIYKETNNPNYEFAPSSTQEAVEGYKIVFQQYGEICAKEIMPLVQEVDSQGLSFKDGKVSFPSEISRIVKIVAESGILTPILDRKYGGLKFPYLPNNVIYEIVSRADASFSLTLGAFNIPKIMEEFGDDELKEKYLHKVSEGEMTSAMALTEPDFGSDLSNIQTKAVKASENGLFELTGTKRYITHGCGLADKPSLIMTLARSKGNGAKGLSFFLVESTDVDIGGIEKKMGLRTSPTCEVIYDKSKGRLIGAEGKGLVKYAMKMMNGARIGIAAQAVGIAQSAYDEALKYSAERQQFGSPINTIPAVKRILDEIDSSIQATRALLYEASEIVDVADASERYTEYKNEAKALEDNSKLKILERLAKLLTPVSKYFNSEISNRVVYNAVQIFGGAGFIEDYPIVRIYRDARITTIYEGTSQLQVVGAIGGIVEGIRESGFLSEYLNAKIESLNNKEAREEFLNYKDKLAEIVSFYKEKNTKEKQALSVDVVDYFSYYFCWLLLAIHQEIAEKKGDPILGRKKKACLNFSIIAKRSMESASIQIQANNFDYYNT